jgi:hypothetical protein
MIHHKAGKLSNKPDEKNRGFGNALNLSLIINMESSMKG